jgi:hypothetical protein
MIFRIVERPNVQAILELGEKHLDNETHVTSLILKGHLVVEHTMNLVIELLDDSVKKYDLERAKFSDKMKLCGYLGLFNGNRTTHDQINLLNKLRNGIAHRLEYDPVEIEQLFNYNKHNLQILTNGMTDTTRILLKKLNICVQGICGAILGSADVKIQLNNYCFAHLPRNEEGFDLDAVGFDDQFKKYLEHYHMEVDDNGNIKRVDNPNAQISGVFSNTKIL